ncbi:MAG TPA: amidohydrolase [Mogibacterium sp.]|nr:amidohydrolase [Mogibacterium sp.]
MKTLVYGNIYTMDNLQPFAEAMYIEDGTVKAIGSRNQFADQDIDQVLDYSGQFIFPGFIDTHIHTCPCGILMKGVQVHKETTVAGVLEAIEKRAKTEPEGQWIFVAGFQDKNMKEKRFPNLEELDRITTSNPIMIVHNDLHPYMCNTCAVEQLQLDPDIDGVVTDENNKPTGMIVDPYCMPLMEKIIQTVSKEELVDGYRKIDEYAVSNGVTTVFTKDYYPIQRILWENRDQFKTTTHPMVRVSDCTSEEDILSVVEDPDFAKRATMCIFADGAFDGWSASVIDPYEGRPYSFGMLYYTDEEMYSFVERVHLEGLQASVHAIGDNAIDQVLRVYEKVLTKYPRADHRHRIEHFECPTGRAIVKAAELGVALGMQPLLLEVCEGMDMEGYRCFIGDRVEKCSPFRSILDMGILVGGGSDFSVTEMKPLRAIMIGMQHPMPGERFTLTEGLKMFTCDAAKLGFMENRKGRLVPGMDADFVVLAENPYITPTEEIADIPILETYIAGCSVYENN